VPSRYPFWGNVLSAPAKFSLGGLCSGSAVAAGFLVLGVVACSPALNWRSVAFGDGSVTLPCKPDSAQRTVQLGAAALSMDMVGCEADGALFAVSRVALSGTADTAVLQAQWQQASLLQMRAQGVPTVEEVRSAGPGGRVLRVLHLLGQRPDTSAVQARLAWVVVGSDLFHLAVYAPPGTPDATEPFFAGVTAP